MPAHYFTMTIPDGPTYRKLRNTEYSINDALCIAFMDDSWIEITVSHKNKQGFDARVMGRALRSKFDSDLPTFTLAFEMFDTEKQRTLEAFEKTKGWWLSNDEKIMMHSVVAQELGLTNFELQHYVAKAVGLISNESIPTIDLPENFTFL